MKVSKIVVSKRDVVLTVIKFLTLCLVIFLAQLVVLSESVPESAGLPQVSYVWAFGWICARIYDLLKEIVDRYGTV